MYKTAKNFNIADNNKRDISPIKSFVTNKSCPEFNNTFQKPKDNI